MADDVAPDLDAAMVAVSSGVPVEAVRRGLEEAFDLAVQGRPVVFHREQIVRALGLDGLGDLGLAAHGIDGDQGSGEGQALEQQRDGGNLIRLGVGGFLPQHQALTSRPGGDEMQRLAALAAVVRAPRSLAVNGDHVGLGLAQTLDPGHKAGLEQRRVERVDDVVEGVVGGKAIFERQEPAQEGQVLHTPEPGFDEILRPRQRCAEHEEHDLRQRVDDLPGLARVLEGREVFDQGPLCRFARHGQPRSSQGGS